MSSVSTVGGDDELSWTTVHFPELELTVRHRALNPTAVFDFEVFDIVGGDGASGWLYLMPGKSKTQTRQIDAAEKLADGQVLWDGCCDVKFAGGNYLHGCSRKDMVRIGALFERLYDLAAAQMPDSAEEFLR